jgi:uncharacterized membrane protein (UPF0127 family)
MKSKRNLIGIFSILIIALLILGISINTRGDKTISLDINSAEDNSILLAKLKNKDLRLEVAKSSEAQAYGLMNRESMDENSGMLFIFAESSKRTFYMKNTLISLDIIYFDEELKVQQIYKNTKPNQTSELYPSSNKTKLVLELNGGWSSDSDLQIGDKLEIVQIEPSKD